LDRAYWSLCLLLLLVALPGRLIDLGASVWLDEAWVANSLLQPRLHDTLFYEHWLQSTPPLLLTLQRLLVPWFGFSEPALRIVPWAGGLLGLIVAAAALRRLFIAPVALAGVTFLLTNYWIAKYSQQVKQYSVDFLVSAVFLLLIVRVVHRSGEARPWVALLVASVVAAFLSYATAFWICSCFATAIACEWAGERRAGSGLAVLGRAALFGAPVTTAVLATYLLFVVPNTSPELYTFWRHSFLNWRHPGETLTGLLNLVGRLTLPLRGRPATAGGILVGAAAVIGIALSIRRARTWEVTALLVVITGALPITAALVLSSIGRYPILDYPRLMLWALPSLTVLLCAALEPLSRLALVANSRQPRQWGEWAIAAACIVAVAGTSAAYALAARFQERNRDAVAYLQATVRADDVVFVHGGMHEAFEYYRRLLSWAPSRVYIGSTDWPCCPRHTDAITSFPTARDFAADLERACDMSRGRELWLMLPAGGWGGARLRTRVAAIPAELKTIGCEERARQSFGETLLLTYHCDRRTHDVQSLRRGDGATRRP